jgi:hypothetical protein
MIRVALLGQVFDAMRREIWHCASNIPREGAYTLISGSSQLRRVP